MAPAENVLRVGCDNAAFFVRLEMNEVNARTHDFRIVSVQADIKNQSVRFKVCTCGCAFQLHAGMRACKT